MLRVTFEVVPFGMEKHPNRREIGRLEIGLKSVNYNNVGSYESRLYIDEKGPSDVEKVVKLKHPRVQGAYSLVKEALKLHLGENNAVADDTPADSA